MNPNYMNFYNNPSGSSEMSLGNSYQSQTSFPGMPSNGGSFMDMINGPPPHMINTPDQQTMSRFNLYGNMYGAPPYGMENSAARLQQFARQMTPRPSSAYNMSGQNMPDPMSYNMDQMTRLRVKHSVDFNVQQPRYSPISPWPRMPHGMPILQQEQAHRASLDMMHRNPMNPDVLQMANMQQLPTLSRNAYRKMPILEEAPLRGIQQQQQHQQFNSYLGRNFPDTTSNTAVSPSYTQNQQNNSQINLSSVESLNLPSVDFNSQQPQPPATLSNFIDNFSSKNISPAVPLSPKLTHFGPSPASSVTSFDQVQTTVVNQKPVVSAIQSSPYTPQPASLAGSPSALKYAQAQSFPISPTLNKPANNSEMKFQSYFQRMQQIQQQLNQLKQGPQTQHAIVQIQILNQQYQMVFRQYEIAKQQPNMFNQPPSTLQGPTIPKSNAALNPSNNVPVEGLLEDSLIGDGLNIPDLTDFSNKDPFLADNTKTESMFPAGFLGTSDLFGGGELFDSLGGGHIKEEKKLSEQTINVKHTTENHAKSVSNSFTSHHLQPTPQQQTFQVLQPIRPHGPNEAFIPFPFHHPQFAMQQQHPYMPHHMSISELLSKTALTTTVTMSTARNNFTSSFSGMPPIPSMHDAQKQRQINKGKGKGAKGSNKERAFRPPAKKKKKEKKVDMEHADFDNLGPSDLLTNDDDETFLDPAMRRSLRERTKKKNYKDDFDYNLSDEEDKNKVTAKDGDGNAQVMEPVISGGANQLLAYRPNLEVEGEIAIIEKILAMRMTQKEEEVPEGNGPVMVEEYFVKYKAYSYLHCEWGTIDQLAKKDKRVHAKIKRYQQKRDTTFAFLNELDDEPFNPDYLEIDRVLDMQTTQDPGTNEVFYHYLVKWRALPYEESTWELQMNIDESIIKQFHELKKPPPLIGQRQFISRPNDMEWKPYVCSPVYKNGNKLHNYQLEGLNWLTFCWFKRINCILADEMGLGKTIQSISLLCAMKQYGIRGPFLVIAPLSTIVNWQREFEEWTDINAIVYHGSAQSRLNIQQYEMHYKDEHGREIPNLYKFEAIITTYEMVLSANSFLCTIPFRCLIIDEAHRLKNQKCKLMEGLNNLQMEHRVLLTGTPLQNNVEELFSLLNFLEPTRFPSQAAFLYEFGDLKTENQVGKLQQILKPMMLRRLKEDVDQNIPSKEETIVEVELTTIQKKFYRAILEKNFSFLAKGTGYSNLPNLMNTMMELRKCCNHPFLIKGAEEKIVSEYSSVPGDIDHTLVQMKALIESSGKMVLIDKLLPKLKAHGHKVLIFSQMIKVLNLIEDYLLARRYLFERIDGGVQGNMRQAAIDRFCRPDSDRFVFLLCTRAGGLGINLTAADTVIIFDSDWNPQNDLQAQARCHRIGQEKPVKVYRLICRNTYEREMFDRASLKLGLDKAVLQNMNAKDGSSSGNQAMSKKEVEDLLKKGAYGAVMETDDDANKFCEEDIDQILERRTQVIQIESEGKGSTFAKASFVSDKARQDIDLDDPDFWQKWAKKASIDIEEMERDNRLIVDEPRKRKQTKRFGNDGDATVEMSDLESEDETYEPHKMNRVGKVTSTTQIPIERAAWTRVECFKVEKNLLVYGWGRWQEIISHAHFRQDMRHSDVEAITRTILAYCFRHVRTDDKSKQFFINLINESVKKAPPKNDKFDITNQILGSTSAKGSRGRKRGSSGRNALRRLTHQYSKPALIECGIDWQTIDDEQMIVDAGYRKHLQHHCNKIMSRVRLLCCLKNEIIRDASAAIIENKHMDEVTFAMPASDGEALAEWWDANADKSLLMGTYKHGYEKYRLIRNDPCLSFYQKLGPPKYNDKPEDSTPAAAREESEKVPSVKKEDDDDSFNESEEEKEDTYSSTYSPASNISVKETPVEAKTTELRWPSATDMNTRLRRLINAFSKSSEKEQMEIIKAEKEKQRQEKQAHHAMERQRKKLELQQKWTRRDESDFYRVLSTFGVVYDSEKKKYNWKKYRELAHLEKKQDESLTAYYEEFMAMCRRVCRKSTALDIKRFPGQSQIEDLSEERASRCLHRVKLLSKIRNEVLPNEHLVEHLKLCELSPDFPSWWQAGFHDKALLEGVACHGLACTEYHVLMDPNSVFKKLVEKPKLPIKLDETNKPTCSVLVNGMSESDKPLHSPLMFGMHTTGENFPFPLMTEEYNQLIHSWPKEKALVNHLDKLTQCVTKGVWPKLTRFDVNFTKPVTSSVISVNQMMPSEKPPALNPRDFKIKSIDGLKLTVKSADVKQRMKLDDDLSSDEVFTENYDEKYPPHEASSHYDDDYPKVQIHIPKSRGEAPPQPPVIHFPSGIKNTQTAATSVIKSAPNKVEETHKEKMPEGDNKLLNFAKMESRDLKLKKSDPPVGIHINSPNSNVRIKGSKIEVNEKPNIKCEIDMSNVVLRVPDPARFLVENKKRTKHFVDEKISYPPLDASTSRPERSAKKRAKDSISEMSEAENLRHIERNFADSPTLHSDFHTPLAIKSRDYYRYEYFTERPPYREERLHRKSPHYHHSPPPLHSEHTKHLHYTEPLSPRYYEPHYYSDRSRSPLYYDYLEKEYSPPPYISPTSSHKHEKYPYHLSETIHSPGHRKHHYSSVATAAKEERFPYERQTTEWMGYAEKTPPLDSPYHYKPLSRSRSECDDFHARIYDKHAKHHPSKPPEKKRTIEKQRDPPTSFYPTDHPFKSNDQPLKSKQPEKRLVIEIPEQSIRSPIERKTPKKQRPPGMGSLLEMKIQGLKKQRMEQLSDTSPTENTQSEKGESHSVKSTNLDNIAKNLTKSVEKTNATSECNSAPNDLLTKDRFDAAPEIDNVTLEESSNKEVLQT